ncbi:transposase IS116/IS110/IS902 family protein [Thioalkalivibrio sp. K90mix]|uniref:IS110 family transposase n=5 Tax=Thioalkalivibrio TaxID=106633 RepID=UPI00019597A3|nr:IS110 family transposase [Thioalkalivibrio sp. K90mix]ADC71561.1 transposase IS116/IS110/IS902 family protein [Thioalkalivibrio sp. K90mix]ADC72199.1 transposase IS116/IS110/IS902 family protein [Thioalkalivibrio sp. K90mix]ADC72559.1 transposase IS116/IS110/IS902 family protein [Thioalkalivibrio sp. K90mix]
MAHIGVDVSKNKLDCMWVRDLEAGKVKPKVFPNRQDQYRELLHWLERNTGETPEGLHVYLEATGIYHEPLAYWLHDQGVQVHVLNPAQVRSHAKGMGVRNKTDRKDSMMLARYGIERAPRRWQPEPPEVRELKRLLSRLEALEQDMRREENRLEKARFSEDTLAQASIDNVLQALREEHRRLQQQIDDHFDAHHHLKRDRTLLESIPGIGRVLSASMTAALRSRAFTSARQAAAFHGLAPVLEESGATVRRPSRLAKIGSSRLRKALYMAAVVATRYNPDVRHQHQRLLTRGKAKMSAIGAAMRKLLHIAFGVLKSQTPYQARHETPCTP